MIVNLEKIEAELAVVAISRRVLILQEVRDSLARATGRLEMKPSERAMTLAEYDRDIRVLVRLKEALVKALQIPV